MIRRSYRVIVIGGGHAGGGGAARAGIGGVGGTVEKIVVRGRAVAGVVVKTVDSGEWTADNSGSRSPLSGVCELSSPAVVLTTGTFMRGLMHTGERKTE